MNRPEQPKPHTTAEQLQLDSINDKLDKLEAEAVELLDLVRQIKSEVFLSTLS